MHGVGPGSLLGGRYLVQRRVAQHSRFERWSAADQTLDRDVVLLCFDADGPVASAALDAARRAAGVEEHRLVRVLDVGRDTRPESHADNRPDSGQNSGQNSGGGVAFVVEEPLTGAKSLTASLADGGLPAEEARRILGETASALERARARGLHHGVLTPRSVFLTDDGGVKVRGLATEAALVDNDDETADEASRADTVALVGLAYAVLTGRWPLDGSDAGLEAAPRVAGGVAAPSEIAAGIPTDLDLLVRTTLADDRGPRTPGELAEQVSPWSATPVTAGMAIRDAPRLSGSRTEPLERDRATGGVAREPRRESGRGWGRGAAPRAGSSGEAAGSSGGSNGSGARHTAAATLGAAAAGAAGAGLAGNGSPRSVLGVPFGSRPSPSADEADGHHDVSDDPQQRGADAYPESDGSDGSDPRVDAGYDGYEEYNDYNDYDGYDEGTAGEGRPSPVAGVVAAGGAMARRMGTALGAAGSGVGDRVGGLARGAADRAAERSASRAERRQAERYEDPGIFGEDVRLSDTLESTDEELEPALPLLPGAAQEPLDRDQSRLVLIVIAAFVIVAAALGLWGLPKLSGIGTTSSGAAAPVVTKTVTASPSDTPSAATTSASTPTATAPPIAIAALSQISQDGGVQSSKTTAAATDGNPDTAWRSAKWYATPQYGGFTDSQVGLLLDLGQPSDVHAVTFTVRGPADVSVLVNDKPKVDGAKTVGTVSGQDGDATVTVPNGGAVKGQYVILWFGTLGPDGEGHYRAQVAEVSVK